MDKAKTPAQALEDAKANLQTAIELEHATIPPYLYAFWSLKDHGSDTASSIYSVIKEEMLHMALACNILNALGGDPNLVSGSFIPDYPTNLPGHDDAHDPLVVALQKCGVEAMVTFMHIELPKDLGLGHDHEGTVDTIGELYNNILKDLSILSPAHFQHGGQISQEFAPYDKGELFDVNSMETARVAINEILEQGEGLSLKDHDEDSDEPHYNRFVDIYNGMGGFGVVVPHEFDTEALVASIDEDMYEKFLNGVNNIVANPKENNADSDSCRMANRRFNSVYSQMLDFLHHAFTRDNPDNAPGDKCSMTEGVRTMLSLTRPALEIMSIPVDANDPSKGFCGPTFEYIQVEDRI